MSEGGLMGIGGGRKPDGPKKKRARKAVNILCSQTLDGVHVWGEKYYEYNQVVPDLLVDKLMSIVPNVADRVVPPSSIYQLITSCEFCGVVDTSRSEKRLEN